MALLYIQSTWHMGGEHLSRDETVCQGRVREGGGSSLLLREGGDSLLREGGDCSSREGWGEGGRRLSIKRRRRPCVEGRRRPVTEGGGEAIHWGRGAHQPREGQGHSSREGGHQLFVERGRTPAIHWEREDTSRTLREGGHLPLSREGGRRSLREGGCHSLREGGGRSLTYWCSGREEQWISTLGNSKFNMITWCWSFNGIRQIAWSCSHSIWGEHTLLIQSIHWSCVTRGPKLTKSGKVTGHRSWRWNPQRGQENAKLCLQLNLMSIFLCLTSLITAFSSIKKTYRKTGQLACSLMKISSGHTFLDNTPKPKFCCVGHRSQGGWNLQMCDTRLTDLWLHMIFLDFAFYWGWCWTLNFGLDQKAID